MLLALISFRRRRHAYAAVDVATLMLLRIRVNGADCLRHTSHTGRFIIAVHIQCSIIMLSRITLRQFSRAITLRLLIRALSSKRSYNTAH